MSSSEVMSQAEQLFDEGDMFVAGLHFADAGDDARAFQCYLLGSEQGRTRRADCLLQLGYACRLGSGTEANESHAFAHFRAAADAAAESIQNIKDDVDGADDDMVAMFQDVQGEACYCIAACLEDGVGVAENVVAAYEWYRRGADLKNSQCLLAFGQACLHGLVAGKVEKNEALAAEFFSDGVELDSTACMRALAQCYLRGRGVRQSVKQAMTLLEIGAEGGDAECAAELEALKAANVVEADVE